MTNAPYDEMAGILRRASEGLAADDAAAKAAAEKDQMVQTAGEALPYMFSLLENLILAVGRHTRQSGVLGYAEFCLRNKVAEALTEYALQVAMDKETDAAALVRAMTVLKDAAAGHASEG